MKLNILTHDEQKPVQVEGEITLQILREDDCFVAYCPELQLSTHGETFEEAKTAFAEVLEMFIEDVIQRGTLEDVLEECGWVKTSSDHENKWMSPPIISTVSLEIQLHRR